MDAYDVGLGGSAYDVVSDLLDACPAGTVLEVWTREGERFEVEAEGGELRDWLPVESAPAPPHLQPNLGSPGFDPRAYSSDALARWFDRGLLVGLGVVSGDGVEPGSTESPSVAREFAGDPSGGPR